MDVVQIYVALSNTLIDFLGGFPSRSVSLLHPPLVGRMVPSITCDPLKKMAAPDLENSVT